MVENIMHTLYECIDKEKLEKAGWTVITATLHDSKEHFVKLINLETKEEILLTSVVDVTVNGNVMDKYLERLHKYNKSFARGEEVHQVDGETKYKNQYIAFYEGDKESFRIYTENTHLNRHLDRELVHNYFHCLLQENCAVTETYENSTGNSYFSFYENVTILDDGDIDFGKDLVFKLAVSGSLVKETNNSIYTEEEMESLMTKFFKESNTSSKWTTFNWDGVTMNIYKKPEDVTDNEVLKPFMKFKLIELNGNKIK